MAISRHLTMPTTAGSDGRYSGSTMLPASAYEITLTKDSTYLKDISTISAPTASVINPYVSTTFMAAPTDVLYRAYDASATTEVTISKAETINLDIAYSDNTGYTATVDSSCTSWVTKTSGTENKFTLTKNTTTDTTASAKTRKGRIVFTNAGGTSANFDFEQYRSNLLVFSTQSKGTLTVSSSTAQVLSKYVDTTATTISNDFGTGATYSYKFTPQVASRSTISITSPSSPYYSPNSGETFSLYYTDNEYSTPSVNANGTTSTEGGVVSNITLPNAETVTGTAFGSAEALDTDSGQPVDWVTVREGGIGAGHYATVVVDASPSLVQRECEIILHASGDTGTTATFLLTQLGSTSVNYTISALYDVQVEYYDTAFPEDVTTKSGTTVVIGGMEGHTYHYTITCVEPTVYTASFQHPTISATIDGLSSSTSAFGQQTSYALTAGTITGNATLTSTAGQGLNLMAEDNWNVTTTNSTDMTLKYTDYTSSSLGWVTNPPIPSTGQTVSAPCTIAYTVPALTTTTAERTCSLTLNNHGTTATCKITQEAGYLITFSTNAPNGTIDCE